MKLSFSLFIAAVAVTSEAHKLIVKKISRTGGPQRRTPGNSAADYQINVASASAAGANAFDLKCVLTSLPQIFASHQILPQVLYMT
jgi:saccharopepsin